MHPPPLQSPHTSHTSHTTHHHTPSLHTITHLTLPPHTSHTSHIITHHHTHLCPVELERTKTRSISGITRCTNTISSSLSPNGPGRRKKLKRPSQHFFYACGYKLQPAVTSAGPTQWGFLTGHSIPLHNHYTPISLNNSISTPTKVNCNGPQRHVHTRTAI